MVLLDLSSNLKENCLTLFEIPLFEINSLMTLKHERFPLTDLRQ